MLEKILHKKSYHLIALSLMLTIQGCKLIYIPNAQNVPLLRERFEVRATGTPTNFQTAFATGKHMGVITNGQYRESTRKGGGYTHHSSKWLSEAGSGAFFALGKNGVFEVYSGAGYGGIDFTRKRANEMDPNNNGDRYSTNFVKTFFQPAIGTTTKDIDFAFSVRYVGLKFTSVDTLGYTSEELILDNLAGIEKPFYNFIEPALTLRVGGKYVKLHTQLVYSQILNAQPLNYKPITFNMGLHLCIAKRNRKPKEINLDIKPEIKPEPKPETNPEPKPELKPEEK